MVPVGHVFQRFKQFSSRSFLAILLAMTAAVLASPRGVQAAGHSDKAQPASLAADTATETAAAAGTLAISGKQMTELPPNLRVPRDLRPLLQQALRRSPTFQRQMKTLMTTQRVRMSVMYGGLRGLRLFQAQSTVTHHEWGALVVDTTLYAPADMVELFAHEMEHVCEQIEGLDLPSLAGRRDSGVYDVGGHFETLRAITAGRKVSREALGLPADEQSLHITY
jgi:hypothetical protein